MAVYHKVDSIKEANEKEKVQEELPGNVDDCLGAITELAIEDAGLKETQAIILGAITELATMVAGKE